LTVGTTRLEIKTTTTVLLFLSVNVFAETVANPVAPSSNSARSAQFSDFWPVQNGERRLYCPFFLTSEASEGGCHSHVIFAIFAILARFSIFESIAEPEIQIAR
jgi:hypothetical protein